MAQHTHTDAHTHSHRHTHTDTHRHTHTHTLTHTHTHTHTHSSPTLFLLHYSPRRAHCRGDRVSTPVNGLRESRSALLLPAGETVTGDGPPQRHHKVPIRYRLSYSLLSILFVIIVSVAIIIAPVFMSEEMNLDSILFSLPDATPLPYLPPFTPLPSPSLHPLIPLIVSSSDCTAITPRRSWTCYGGIQRAPSQ